MRTWTIHQGDVGKEIHVETSEDVTKEGLGFQMVITQPTSGSAAIIVTASGVVDEDGQHYISYTLEPGTTAQIGYHRKQGIITCGANISRTPVSSFSIFRNI